MEKIEYNKLVRDKIPEIIKKNNEIPATEVLKWREYMQALKDKVCEEAQELADAGDRKEVLNELADLQELIDTIRKESKLTKAQITTAQKKKRQERGGFKKRIFLKWTEKNS
ncbi:hypothetical protein ACFL1U_02780 [Patescibacteria group bacterium]